MGRSLRRAQGRFSNDRYTGMVPVLHGGDGGIKRTSSIGINTPKTDVMTQDDAGTAAMLRPTRQSINASRG